MSVFNETLLELKLSINSILNQKYPNFELIIIDDNPNSKRIKRYLLNVQAHNSIVQLRFNKVNLGAALSRNKGIHYANGKFIAIMDADDIASKYRLYCQFKFLFKYNLDFVFPNYRTISDDGLLIKSKVYKIHSIIKQNVIDYILMHIRNISINSGWLLKKKIFYNLNGYRNSIIEDYDFISRSIIYGYKLGYQSKILMSVRLRPNSRMRSDILRVFLNTEYIQKYFSKGEIISINGFNEFYNKHVTSKDELKFNEFIKDYYKLRNKINLKNVYNILLDLFFTKYSGKFLINKIVSRIKMLHVRG